MHIIQEASASVRSYKLIIIVVTLLCITSLNAIADSTISITADNTNPDVGQNIRLAVAINNAEKVFGVQFVLRYDPKILSVVSIEPGEVFTSERGSTAGPSLDNRSGYSWSYMRRFGDPAGFSGSGVLAYIDMVVVGNGQAQITLTDVLLASVTGDSLPVMVNPGVIIKVGSDGAQDSGGEGSTSQNNTSTVSNIVSLSPVTDQTASLNGSKKVRLDVKIDNADKVTGAEFILYYNPSTVSINSVIPGEVFTSDKGSLAGSARNNPGVYSWSYQKSSGDSKGFSGNGVVAYIDVTASGNGLPEISLNDVTLTNSSGEKMQATVEKPLKVASSFNASKATNKLPARGSTSSPPRAMTGETIPFFKRLLMVLVILGVLGLVHLYVVRRLAKS